MRISRSHYTWRIFKARVQQLPSLVLFSVAIILAVLPDTQQQPPESQGEVAAHDS